MATYPTDRSRGSTATYPTLSEGVTPEAFGYSFAGATKSDPNSLETAALTESAGRQTLTIGSPGVASPLPDAALTYTLPLVDLIGQPTVTLQVADIMRLILMTFGAPGVPVDQVLMCGLSAGGVPTAGRRGVAMGFVPSGGNWQPMATANLTGAGWSAWGTAVALAANRGLIGHLAATNGSQTTSSWGCSPCDASGVATAGNGVHAARAWTTTTLDFSHFFIGAGWNTGVGGTAGAYTFAARAAVMELAELLRMVPT
jgi:hypothetical protein